MTELQKLQNLKRALSTELERRPKEERDRLKRESAERAALRQAWEHEYPWIDFSRLTADSEKEFRHQLREAREQVIPCSIRFRFVSLRFPPSKFKVLLMVKASQLRCNTTKKLHSDIASSIACSPERLVAVKIAQVDFRARVEQ